jgi:hypothetical protein
MPRLPLAIPLDARSASSTKDGRLTNAVVETYQGKTVATARPGLVQLAAQAGTANGTQCLDGVLLTIYGGNLYKTTAMTLVSAVDNEPYDFAHRPT